MGFPRMIVKCVDDRSVALCYGEEYDVEWCTPSYYFIKNDNGATLGFSSERFVVIQEGAPTLCNLEDSRDVDEFVAKQDEVVEQPHNKYSREIKPGVFVDVYDVLRAFNVQDPCLQHLLKKALAAGCRGHKDTEEDLRDILASAQRAVEMYETWKSN